MKWYIKTHKTEISDELADTMIYLLNLAERLDIEVLKSIERKLAKNERKYPLAKVVASLRHGFVTQSKA